jgi:hypothetical protein
MNPARGDVALVLGGQTYCLRPSYQALVAAEAEIGPLFAVIERTCEGRLTLAEMSALLWHCLDNPSGFTRDTFGAALVAEGLAAVTPSLRALLEQVLAGALR